MPVIVVLPARRMAEVAFEVMQSRYGGPLPVVQQSTGIEQDVSGAFQDLLLRWYIRIGDFELEIPFACRFVPDGGN